MASPRFYQDKQTSFAGGRFSPELHGRTDLAKYTSAFKDSKNFFVSPEGTLLNRAGTALVDQVTGNAQNDPNGEPSRLVPFIFSDDDVVIIAFGGEANDLTGYGFVRFYSYDRTTDAITLLDTTVQQYTWDDPYDPNSTRSWQGDLTIFPWSKSQAAAFRFVQVGDALYITYENASKDSVRQPFKLTRATSDSTVWHYELLNFTPQPFPSHGGTPRLKEQAYIYGAETTDADDVHLPEEDATHPARVWQWAVSRVMMTSEGEVYETLPFIVTHSVRYRVEAWNENWKYPGAFSYVYIKDPDYASSTVQEFYEDNWFYTATGLPVGDRPVHLDGGSWDVVAGSALDPVLNTKELPSLLVCYADRPQIIDWRVFTQRPETIASDADTIIATRVYKGRDGHFGFVGETGPDAQEFVDDGLVPDFATPPRTEDNHLTIKSPWPIGHDNYVAPVREWPSALGMYEGRFVMAATETRPGLVVGSAVDRYKVIDAQEVAKDADPYAFMLASLKWEKIRFMVARHGLYLFTSEGEWVAAGSGQYEILTPNSIAVRQVSDYGSASLHPLVVGETVLFIENTGCEPRAFFMQGMQSKSMDMVSYSRAFFRGRQVVSWCWAEVPWQTIWLVMDDGKMLSCCWNPEQQMVAWAEHEIEDGLVKSVVSIPADKEHGVVLLVKRGTKYYMERMCTRILTDVRDSRFLDSHVFYDGRNTSTNTVKITQDTGSAIGAQVYVEFTAGTETEGQWENHVVRVYGTVITVTGTDEYGDDITTSTPTFVEVLLTSSEDPDLYLGELLTPLIDELDQIETTSWEVCKSAMTGLSHLEGESVVALVDGEVIRNLTVNGGMVNLDGSEVPPNPRWAHWGAVICVGLNYNCDFESLAIAQENGRQRVVRSVLVETYGSRGGYVGQDLDDTDNLEEVITRTVQHEYGVIPLTVEEVPTTIRASYDIKGEIGFRQSDPLPVSITKIIREVEFGDR